MGIRQSVLISVALSVFLIAAQDAAAQTTFTEQTVLVGADAAAGHRTAESVAMDGDVLLFSSEGYGVSGDEAAYFFRKVGGTWIEQQKAVSNLAGSCAFGTALAIDDGKVVVGDPTQDFTGFCSGNGQFTPYLDAGATWTKQPVFLGAQNMRSFGASAVIRGKRMLIGAHGQTTSIGIFEAPVVVAYEFNGGDWQATQVFAGSDTGTYDKFGNAIAMSEDGLTAVIGASKTDSHTGVKKIGAAYVFRFDGTNWVEEQKLLASDASFNDEFGYSVAISDEVVSVGAPFDSGAFQRSGSIYIFRFDGVQWTETQNIGAAVPSLNAQFGYALSADGPHLAVGEPVADVAHIYRDNAGSYLPVQELVSSSEVGNGFFGRSIWLDDTTCLVGAPFASVAGTGSGAALLFEIQELALTVDSTVAQAGQKLTIVTSGGVPGSSCTLILSTRNKPAGIGSLGFGSVAMNPGVFGVEGRCTTQMTVPPGFSGGAIVFKSYGMYLPGVVGQSNPATVVVQ